MKPEKLVLLILTAGFVLGSITFIQQTTLTGAAIVENNTAPIWQGPDTMYVNNGLTIDLTRAFYDADGDVLVYEVSAGEGLHVELREGSLIIQPKQQGEHLLSLFASDGTHITRKLLILR